MKVERGETTRKSEVYWWMFNSKCVQTRYLYSSGRRSENLSSSDKISWNIATESEIFLHSSKELFCLIFGHNVPWRTWVLSWLVERVSPVACLRIQLPVLSIFTDKAFYKYLRNVEFIFFWTFWGRPFPEVIFPIQYYLIKITRELGQKVPGNICGFIFAILWFQIILNIIDNQQSWVPNLTNIFIRSIQHAF